MLATHLGFVAQDIVPRYPSYYKMLYVRVAERTVRMLTSNSGSVGLVWGTGKAFGHTGLMLGWMTRVMVGTHGHCPPGWDPGAVCARVRQRSPQQAWLVDEKRAAHRTG